MTSIEFRFGNKVLDNTRRDGLKQRKSIIHYSLINFMIQFWRTYVQIPFIFLLQTFAMELLLYFWK